MNMNTTASYTSEPLWNKRTSSESISEPSHSRRCSTETIFSIQGRETDVLPGAAVAGASGINPEDNGLLISMLVLLLNLDVLRDTSDTEWFGSDDERQEEFEPVTEPEEEAPVNGSSSGTSDNEIISTKVVEVLVGDDGDLEFADSEQTASGGSDSEIDFYDYWKCAQCRAENNNPLYRYCEKCFKVRKNFFPPRPKRKHKVDPAVVSDTITRTLSQDSGVESASNSQQLSQEPSGPDREDGPDQVDGPDRAEGPSQANSETRLSNNVILNRNLKRRAESADRKNKRIRIAYSGSESDSESDRTETKPLVKMVSDPALTVDDPDLSKKATKEKLDDNMCIMCYSNPKSGVFAHGSIAHICCCYKCAMQVWAKARRCPICNRRVSKVMKAIVM